jgi:hypothetical protein
MRECVHSSTVQTAWDRPADDIKRIKEIAGFTHLFFPAVEPSLQSIYTNTAVLGWYLSFQVCFWKHFQHWCQGVSDRDDERYDLNF